MAAHFTTFERRKFSTWCISVQWKHPEWKSAQRHKHCALAVVRRIEKFRPATVPHRRTESAMAVVRQSQNSPAADPFSGAQDRQNLISWRWSLPTPTDPVWWGSMHVISSYRGNRHRPPQTHRQDRLQYIAPLTSTQCNDIKRFGRF